MRPVDPERTTQRREQILEAALVCFKDKGFHGAAMSAICKQASMSPGHVYHYFSSKEDIIKAIVDIDCKNVENDVENLFDESKTLEIFLKRVDEIWVDESAFKGALNAEISAEAYRNERIRKIIQERDNRILECLSNAIKLAQQKGSVDPSIDVDGFALVFLELIHGLTASIGVNQGKNLEKIKKTVRYVLEKTLRP